MTIPAISTYFFTIFINDVPFSPTHWNWEIKDSVRVPKNYNCSETGVDRTPGNPLKLPFEDTRPSKAIGVKR